MYVYIQHSNTGTSNTTSWLKSGIDVEKKDTTTTTTTTTSDPKNLWPQDKMPDMSILKFDPKKNDRSEKASTPTLASYLAASMRSSQEASSWLEQNVSRFEDVEYTYYKNGVYNAPFQILHAGDSLYEINASITENQDDDNILCCFTRLFDYLLSKSGGFERVVVSMGKFDIRVFEYIALISYSYVLTHALCVRTINRTHTHTHM